MSIYSFSSSSSSDSDSDSDDLSDSFAELDLLLKELETAPYYSLSDVATTPFEVIPTGPPMSEVSMFYYRSSQGDSTDDGWIWTQTPDFGKSWDWGSGSDIDCTCGCYSDTTLVPETVLPPTTIPSTRKRSTTRSMTYSEGLRWVRSVEKWLKAEKVGERGRFGKWLDRKEAEWVAKYEDAKAEQAEKKAKKAAGR